MVIDFYIPTFGRSHKLQEVYNNIVESLKDSDVTPLVWFIVEKHDPASIEAAINVNGAVIVNGYEPCYGGAINYAYERTSAPWFFVGADDISFHYGWLEKLKETLQRRFKEGKDTGVLGTNDLFGERSTHFLVSRDYIQTKSGIMDKVNTVYYPYKHNFTDVELFRTAEHWGMYENVRDSIVEHMHHVAGKAPHDATYAKEEVTLEEDRPVFLERMAKFGFTDEL